MFIIRSSVKILRSEISRVLKPRIFLENLKIKKVTGLSVPWQRKEIIKNNFPPPFNHYHEVFLQNFFWRSLVAKSDIIKSHGKNAKCIVDDIAKSFNFTSEKIYSLKVISASFLESLFVIYSYFFYGIPFSASLFYWLSLKSTCPKNTVTCLKSIIETFEQGLKYVRS